MQPSRNASLSDSARWAILAAAILIAVHALDVAFETLTGPFAQQARVLYAMWPFQRLVAIGMFFNGAVAFATAYALVARHTASPPAWRFAMILAVLGVLAHRLTPFLFGGVLEALQSLEGPERLVRIVITGTDMALAALVTIVLVWVAVRIAQRVSFPRPASIAPQPLDIMPSATLYGAMVAALWLAQLRLGWATDMIPEAVQVWEILLLLFAPVAIGTYTRHLVARTLLNRGATGPVGVGRAVDATGGTAGTRTTPMALQGLRPWAILAAAIVAFVLAGIAAWILVHALTLVVPLFGWDAELGLLAMLAALPAAVKVSLRGQLRREG